MVVFTNSRCRRDSLGCCLSFENGSRYIPTSKCDVSAKRKIRSQTDYEHSLQVVSRRVNRTWSRRRWAQGRSIRRVLFTSLPWIILRGPGGNGKSRRLYEISSQNKICRSCGFKGLHGRCGQGSLFVTTLDMILLCDSISNNGTSTWFLVQEEDIVESLYSPRMFQADMHPGWNFDGWAMAAETKLYLEPCCIDH